MEINIADLRLDDVGRATFGIVLEHEKQLPEWKCQLLLIVVEELMLNALSSKGMTDKIVITSNDGCLFAIENSSESKIPDRRDLERGISTGIMGGLHTAYFLVEDTGYLGMRFEIAEPRQYNNNPTLYRNLVRIVEADYG